MILIYRLNLLRILFFSDCFIRSIGYFFCLLAGLPGDRRNKVWLRNNFTILNLGFCLIFIMIILKDFVNITN
jgi:hypothetical protein